MTRFEDLQELWQKQPAPGPAPFDYRGLSQELERFGRQQLWINGLKVAVLVFSFVRLVTRIHWTPLAVCGLALIYGGVIAYLVIDWRNQIGISRLDFSSPSMDFVRDAHARLQHQLNPMRRHFWPLVISIGGGFNLMLFASHDGSASKRVWAHLTATTVPFVAYVVGNKIREFRFQRECGAVLERLAGLLRTMERRSL